MKKDILCISCGILIKKTGRNSKEPARKANKASIKTISNGYENNENTINAQKDTSRLSDWQEDVN